MQAKTLAEAFADKFIPEALTGCWIWTAAAKPDGYGTIRNKYRTYSAHRVSYELHFGAIPDGLHVLHRCDNPACVAPHHLFLGTHTENMEDKVEKRRHEKLRMDSCKHGHPYTDENTCITKDGHRRCRACGRAQRNKDRSKHKEQQ